MQELSVLAHELSNISGETIRKHYRTRFSVSTKYDKTPVTIADREVEERLRDILEKERPNDGIIGEEFGIKPSQNGMTWVLDPIDGTKSFIIGRPTFGTLISLWKENSPILGIINQPILREEWMFLKGKTKFNGTSIKTRKCPSLSRACVASTSPSQIPGLWPSLSEECKAMIWGGDCYSYGLLASGWLDVVIEAGLSSYDFAALIPIVEGAGGLMCDWDGKPLTLNSDGRILALGDPALKDQALELINAQRT